MTIMPFEGVQYPTLEDEYGVLPTTEADENPVSAEDEAWYCDYVLSGEADEDERDYGDWAEDTYDPDGWQVAQDRYDRWVYGD